MKHRRATRWLVVSVVAWTMALVPAAAEDGRNDRSQPSLDPADSSPAVTERVASRGAGSTSTPQEGAPVATLPEHRARIYPVRSARLWAVVNETLDEHRFRFEWGRIDPEHGVAFPKWRKVPSKHLPGFPPEVDGNRVVRFRLQAFVPQGVEPGRLYVSSMVELEDHLYTRSKITFHARAIHDWFYDRVEARLRIDGVALPEDPGEVWGVLERIAPWAVDPSCKLDPVDRLAHLEEVPPSMLRTRAPVRIPSSYTDPFVPHRNSRSERTARVMVTGNLREDGWPSDLCAVNVSGESTAFAVAAVNAVSFWRFEPLRLAGCPAATTLQVDVKFTP